MRLQFCRSSYFLALLGAVVLLIPTFLNGYPFFYYDSSAYVRGPDFAIREIINPKLTTVWSGVEVASDKILPASSSPGEAAKTILSGRSVYYGFLVYVGYVLSDFWLAAFLQAYIVAAIVGLLFLRCWQIFSARRYFLTLTFLSVLTPLGFFAGFMMPDIFAAAAILAIVMLFVYSQQLELIDVIFLAGLLILSFAFHSSHIAFALVMLPLLTIVAIFFAKDRVARFRALTLVIFCLTAAGALELVFNQITFKVVGRFPLRLPYLTARLTELDPGLRYLDHACTPPQYAVCAYRARLPLNWNAFMFDNDAQTGVFAPADFATKRQLSDEQVRFALHVFLFEPAQTIRGLMGDFGRQLVMFSVNDAKMPGVGENFPQQIGEKIKASNIYSYPEIIRQWSTVTYVVTIFSLAVVIFGLFRLRSNHEMSAFALSVWITLLGVLANAFVCAVLASPFDRFQARVIWLVPLLAFGTWFVNERLGSSVVYCDRAVRTCLAD